jgi:hypothetical protein
LRLMPYARSVISIELERQCKGCTQYKARFSRYTGPSPTHLVSGVPTTTVYLETFPLRWFCGSDQEARQADVSALQNAGRTPISSLHFHQPLRGSPAETIESILDLYRPEGEDIRANRAWVSCTDAVNTPKLGQNRGDARGRLSSHQSLSDHPDAKFFGGRAESM